MGRPRAEAQVGAPHRRLNNGMTASFTTDNLQELLNRARPMTAEVGDRLARPDQFTAQLLFIRSGSARLLVESPDTKAPITAALLGPGNWVGWSNLLNGNPCEWVSAATKLDLLAVPAEQIAQQLWQSEALFERVLALEHPALAAEALKRWLVTIPDGSGRNETLLKQAVSTGHLKTIPLNAPLTIPAGERWITANWAIDKPGRELQTSQSFGSEQTRGPLVPLAWAIHEVELEINQYSLAKPEQLAIQQKPQRLTLGAAPDAYSLGLRDDTDAALSDRFSEYRGNGQLGQRLAVLQMLAKASNIPYRRDQLQKVLKSLDKRGKQLSLAHLGQLATIMGLSARPASLAIDQISNVRTPFLTLKNREPLIVHAIEGRDAVVGDGKGRLRKLSINALNDEGDDLQFVLINRPHTAPNDQFGWGWVWDIVRRYRGALVLVLVVSLVAQVFSLGVPLLLQQLIDKVLSQGNLSSLNALAGLMVAFALFQGILTALRTFLFVDTTDRIDLTLGSAVIDRLVRLPLGFFEKRPVGELSQRLGELNNIRSFLTGTAITTFLDLVFSGIYLVVMLAYSPALTAIALSTFPIYLVITLFAAPVYKQQLRKRAIAQARTQSHLIETLGGIQTVKAQHGELRARWKWQERYQGFVEQGYKSVVLGTTTGQLGAFLNTLSGLLILWAGLSMVLKGEFTLGQLLAFRIFAGYVTQPLLRLSNLWQGLQGVNLSMERLADIVNQPTEAGEHDAEQLALPPIQGDVMVQDLTFRFGSTGPLQLDAVNINVEAGEFVGVVGLSGSGKSTLMKLIARLYPPLGGRIFIDGTDINKVQLGSLRSQIGLVPQDSVLFEGSISDNIALNDPNIDSEEIVKAAKLACAHDFIMDLQDGYATRVAEKGANFSGGQRQRLAIARMLIEHPSLLIMDEATSALDADTERKVSRNLMDIFKDRTVFFVTHRLATVMHADRIIVMDRGRVIEMGTPQDLLQQSGMFASLWEQQS